MMVGLMVTRVHKFKTGCALQSAACGHFCKVYIGKAIPLQAWTGPEGSRTLRLPDFKTFGT
jgi:hypothetical protein